jgi:hypothetical protein
VYAPQFGGNKEFVSTCQDCHMRDVTGVAANKNGTIVRTDLPLHDMTGGNTFVPGLIDAVYPGETNAAALAAGVLRARNMLQLAATLEVSEPAPVAGGLGITVRVTNETGHKLPSGYPEGRRIWLNVKAFDNAGILVYESGGYDLATGVLTHDEDVKIYEVKPGISSEVAQVVGLPEGPSFHFVLNNEVFSDNRIPPRGFTNAAFEAIQSPPVGYSYADGQHWDETGYLLPAGSERIEVTLYYQTTSKEYVEFLRDENRTNDWGRVFHDLWAANGRSAPEVMARAVVGGGVSPARTMYITSIAVSPEGKGRSYNGLAVVAVADNLGAPVAGAVVSGTFYTLNANVKTGTTGSTGVAEIRSDKAKSPPAAGWCFRVTGIALDGVEYAPSENVVSETCAAGKGFAATEATLPGEVTLDQNYPNPFNPSTTIRFTLPEAGEVALTVHDLSGQLVDVVFEGGLGAGRHEVAWHAGDRASGAYLLRLRTGDRVLMRQMMLVK